MNFKGEFMKVAGIIAEYNPFHNGHEYLAQIARSQGCSHIIAVMSGNFVQRAQIAISEKRTRAESALHGGVDLVIELPAAHSTATAQKFALRSVELLKATGVIDTIVFGSELGESAQLSKIASALTCPQTDHLIKTEMQTGITFAKARANAIGKLLGDWANEVISRPNNILGIEYLSSLKAIGWQPEILTVMRKGAAHDSEKMSGRFASASALRVLSNDPQNLSGFVPEPSLKVYIEAFNNGIFPTHESKLETATLAALRSLDNKRLLALPDLSEGLENRFLKAIRNSCTINEILEKTKSKRYTHARVRRLLLSAFLGTTKKLVNSPAPYLRVLGANYRGRELLAVMKKTALLPISSRLASLEKCGIAASEFVRFESHVTDLFTLALPVPKPCGYDYTAPAVFI